MPAPRTFDVFCYSHQGTSPPSSYGINIFTKEVLSDVTPSTFGAGFKGAGPLQWDLGDNPIGGCHTMVF